MRKGFGDHGFPVRPTNEGHGGHPNKAISINSEVLEEILRDAGLEELHRG
ncbi:MAG TPA: hypothetical protein VIL07_11080 [Symbiobacteriaceae bacterium]